MPDLIILNYTKVKGSGAGEVYAPISTTGGLAPVGDVSSVAICAAKVQDLSYSSPYLIPLHRATKSNSQTKIRAARSIDR